MSTMLPEFSKVVPSSMFLLMQKPVISVSKAGTLLLVPKKQDVVTVKVSFQLKCRTPWPPNVSQLPWSVDFACLSPDLPFDMQ